MPCDLSTLRPSQAWLDLPFVVELFVARVIVSRTKEALRLSDLRIGALIVTSPDHASTVPHLDIVLSLACSGGNRGSSGLIQASHCGSYQVLRAPVQIEFC